MDLNFLRLFGIINLKRIKCENNDEEIYIYETYLRLTPSEDVVILS